LARRGGRIVSEGAPPLHITLDKRVVCGIIKGGEPIIRRKKRIDNKPQSNKNTNEMMIH